MGKIAFVFPGQGAQVVGMGQNVYENSAVAKDVFEQASKAVDLDLKALCFEENNDINITEFTQVCLLTTSVAIMEELKTRGVKADVAAGLSLGEYCALVAAGSMNFVDAAKAVRKRGIFMQEEVPAGKGGMAAILGMDAAEIDKNIEEFDKVQVANYNCPGQIVISGETEHPALKTASPCHSLHVCFLLLLIAFRRIVPHQFLQRQRAVVRNVTATGLYPIGTWK